MKYYSQFGEDKFLVENFDLPEKGVFVDVGAAGIEGSNSYYFELMGWDCLCIEPDERHDTSMRKLVDRSVVGSSERVVNFVQHRLPNLSGLYHQEKGTDKQMYTLDTILAKHGITHIDILSIDVEGNEIDVLKGFSIDIYKPSYIIIEYVNQFTKNRGEQIIDILNPQYKCVQATQSNFIFKL